MSMAHEQTYHRTVSAQARHVVIAGAGIVGLSAALELADSGFRVTVIERGRAMEQASWAAAGMLAVEDPENAPELLPLSRLSRSLYPAFLARVEALSALRVPLRTEQTLQAGHERAQSPAVEYLSGLRTDLYGFTLLAEASLDPRDLCRALPRAAVAAGVTLRESQTVTAVVQGEAGVTVQLRGLNGDEETLAADHFVLAGGAWSGQAIAGLPPMPVAPRKGQMIEVTLEGPALPMVVRTPALYLVPRGDGRVAIGATVEHAGFDRTIEEDAGERLWAAAARVWPPVRQGRITARWTGLRPGFVEGLEDALPVIGRLRGNAWAATAHFRNGILLAPGTARVLRECLMGMRPAVSLEAFRADRFGAEPGTAPEAAGERDRAPGKPEWDAAAARS